MYGESINNPNEGRQPALVPRTDCLSREDRMKNDRPLRSEPGSRPMRERSADDSPYGLVKIYLSRTIFCER